MQAKSTRKTLRCIARKPSVLHEIMIDFMHSAVWWIAGAYAAHKIQQIVMRNEIRGVVGFSGMRENERIVLAASASCLLVSASIANIICVCALNRFFHYCILG